MSGAASTRDWPVFGASPQPRARATGEALAQLLECERMSVAALAVRAIAEAWECGRIAAPTELPHERTVPGLLGVPQGLATEHLQAAERALAEVAEDARTIVAATGGLASPLDEVCAEAGLSQLERMVLVIAAAPRLWGELAQLYAILANGASRPFVDEHLVRALLGPRLLVHELARTLDADGALRRHGLISVDEDAPRPFAAIAVDPLLLMRLRGCELDHDPDGQVEVVAAPPSLDALHLGDDVVRALDELVAAHGDAAAVRVVMSGRPGSGRRTLLAALAARAGRRLALVHVERLRPADHLLPTAADLGRTLRRCQAAGWIPCLDGFGALDDVGLRAKLAAVIAQHPGPIAVRAAVDEHPPITVGFAHVKVPDLGEAERAQLWRRALAPGATAADDDRAEIAARWRIGAGTIHQVARTLGAAPSAAQIGRAVSAHLTSGLGEVAELVRDLPRLADVVLPADIVDSLVEFQARIRLRRQVFDEWGMASVATTGRGISALFAGPPGTGKTMVAGALARELGLELYRVDLSRVMSKWIGETERNLARVFAAAEQSQAIILFDEADSLFSKRTEVRSSNDRFANLEVNYLLQRLDSYLGVVILTTNFGTAIDPAFRRRLSFRITFPVPDDELREQLWRGHLPATLPLADDVDPVELARRYALTGGSVRNCVMRAAFLAAAEGARVSQAHLQRAIAVEYRSVGKLTESGALE
jgi:hypothetical protein